MYRFLCEHTILLLSGEHPGMGLLGYLVSIYKQTLFTCFYLLRSHITNISQNVLLIFYRPSISQNTLGDKVLGRPWMLLLLFLNVKSTSNPSHTSKVCLGSTRSPTTLPFVEDLLPEIYNIISFSLSPTSIPWFCSWGNWGPERLNNFLKFPQLVSDWDLNPCVLSPSLVLLLQPSLPAFSLPFPLQKFLSGSVVSCLIPD